MCLKSKAITAKSNSGINFYRQRRIKKEVIAFLINDWETKTRMIADKYLYVDYEDKCYCFTQVTIMMSQNYLVV